MCETDTDPDITTTEFAYLSDLERLILDTVDDPDDYDIDAIVADMLADTEYDPHLQLYIWSGTEADWYDTILAHVIAD